jgi:hypothetical protein
MAKTAADFNEPSLAKKKAASSLVAPGRNSALSILGIKVPTTP